MEIKENYNQEYFKRSFGPLDKNRVIVERKRLKYFKKYLNRNDQKINILDIGCGLGYFLNLCDGIGWQTFGVDISTYAIAYAGKYTKAKLDIINIKNDKLPYENDFFDVITCFDVVEHLENDNIIFKEINRVLNKEGLLIISTPDGKSPYDREETHINIYTKNELAIELEQHNFKILNLFENRGYTERIIPLRRFRFFNWLNQRLCDIFGRYVREVVIIAKK